MQNRAFLRKNVSVAALDELVYELRCTVDMLKAVQVAMVEGPDSAESYTDALFGTIIAFWDLIDKFSSEIYDEVKDHE